MKMVFGYILLVTALLMATGALKAFESKVAPYIPLWSTQL